jgi:hypothetical protein
MTAAPAPRANQKTSFSPALKRPAGGCFDLMKPPPSFSRDVDLPWNIVSDPQCHDQDQAGRE